MRLRIVLAMLLAGSGALPNGCKGSRQRAERSWPRRPIQISCFADAGGGTDTVCRAIAAAMEPHLGAKINVTNRTGGAGGIALHYVWSRERDGYNWGGFSETILPASVMGGHHTTARDWTYYMVAGAPGVLSVNKSSAYRTLKDFVGAAKANPGKIRVAAAITGGLWHTKLVFLTQAAGIEVNVLPYKGSNPSQLAVLSGEADAVLTSVSEQAELIKEGLLAPLAMIEAKPYDFPGHGVIPAAAADYPRVAQAPVRQWLGFALPADTPPEVLAKVDEAFDRAMASPEIARMAGSRQLTLLGLRGREANTLARRMESAWTWLLYEHGMAQKSPAEFGIPKPSEGAAAGSQADTGPTSQPAAVSGPMATAPAAQG
jgi:tripartite-type tricarboxylate transporter receptor subunit TctC